MHEWARGIDIHQYKHKPQNNMKYKMFFSDPPPLPCISALIRFSFFSPFVHLAWSVDSQEWGSDIALSDQMREGRQMRSGGVMA